MQKTYYDLTALKVLKGKKPLLVCDDAFDSFGIELPCDFVRFSGFRPNPQYEDARAGAKMLRTSGCDFIVAIGGGSSIDTAKSIKYYNRVDLPLMAVPTTSGTGSEATHFAVLYRNGRKHSIANERLLPDYVVLHPETLRTLPVYQKKCTMLDALCQAIESWWSKRATEESIKYSKKAIKLIINNMDGYLKNDHECNKKMLVASNIAGKAINTTTTTAPHAMSYSMTSLYGLPHGHAVALCLPKVWRYMSKYDDIAWALGKKSYNEAILYFECLIQELEISPPVNACADDLSILTSSVNTQRLLNNPVRLDKETIRSLYKEILEI